MGTCYGNKQRSNDLDMAQDHLSDPRPYSNDGCPCFHCDNIDTYFFITHGLFVLPTCDRDFYVSYSFPPEIGEVPLMSSLESEDELLPGCSPRGSISRKDSTWGDILSLTTPKQFAEQVGFEIRPKCAHEDIWKRLRTYEIDSPRNMKAKSCWKSDRETKVFLWWPAEINPIVRPIVEHFTNTPDFVSICKLGEACNGIHLPCMTANDLNDMYKLCLFNLRVHEVVHLVWEYAAIAWSIPAFRT